MNKKYQNYFFLFGLLVLIIMASQLDFRQAWAGIQHAGYWFANVLVLWAFLYMINTASWYLIINTIGNEQGVCRKCKVGFWWLYKITVSAFALNYATPGGLMGGEPYRIMSLSPKIGGQRASSSVILYVMTHIYSHFWFWFLSVPLYVVTQKMTPLSWVILPLIAGIALLAIWFFLRGYKRGIAMTGMKLLSHFPMVKKWAQPTSRTIAKSWPRSISRLLLCTIRIHAPSRLQLSSSCCAAWRQRSRFISFCLSSCPRLPFLSAY